MDGKKPDRSYVANFAQGLRKLVVARRELFADRAPHLDAIRQQKDSDCYFNSAVGAIAKERPQIIVKMIRQNQDGSFTVVFPGHAAQKIPAPTDAEIAAYTGSADGLWFNVLERLMGRSGRSIPRLSPTNRSTRRRSTAATRPRSSAF